jgi:hypothetical protein
LFNFVVQKLPAVKQQYADGPVEQYDVPPRPPWAQIHPSAVALNQQTCVGSEQPLKHKASAFPQLIPTEPQILQPVATVIVRFE